MTVFTGLGFRVYLQFMIESGGGSVYMLLRIKIGVWPVRGKCYAAELHPQP